MPAINKIRPVTGAILSGGLSIRMGTPKDRLQLPDGRSMIRHVIDVMLSVCKEIIVAGPEQPGLAEENERIHFVKDNYPGKGPLSGVEAVLSTGYSSAYLIAACDQPLLDVGLLRLLVQTDKNLPCFFTSSENDCIQPLPGYYPVAWLSEIRDSLRQNKLALKSLIAGKNVILHALDARESLSLFSINTKYDLSRITLPDQDRETSV